MEKLLPSNLGRPDQQEEKKRKREWAWVWTLGLVFLILTWAEFKIFDMSQSLPFVHSIFFFGLVNFNIILFLLLIFLIFRNIVKNFSEQEDSFAGRSLKSKLIAAFVSFTFIPTTLMFLVSVFYINNSFDKWFSEKMAGVFKSSIEVTHAYYTSAKRKNFHYAGQIAQGVGGLEEARSTSSVLGKLRQQYSLDSVEYYPDVLEDRTVSVDSAILSEVPQVSLEFLNKGLVDRVEASVIHQYGEGNLVRVIVPVEPQGAVVVSSFVPLSLTSKMDDVALAYEEFRDTDPLAYPLKSIYLIILVLMTLVILLGATWFGFYLARQLSIPLEILSRASKNLAEGDFEKVTIKTGSPEINQLIDSFNQMSSAIEVSEKKINSANKDLRITLDELDKHNRYIEVVLENVSTGVISIGANEQITMVNRYAEDLLGISARDSIGRNIDDVLSLPLKQMFSELGTTLLEKKLPSIQKELQLQLVGGYKLIRFTLTYLYDENQRQIGRILAFDDISPLVSAQRAAAWTEVARRIAHEIKNPLTPISLSAQRLRRKFGAQVSDPAFNSCTQMIIDQVDDLKNLVNEFSRFARLPKSNPILGSLNKVVKDAVSLFEQTDSQITLKLELEEQLPEFLFDPDQLKRVITNLLDNAYSGVAGIEVGEVMVKTDFDRLHNIARLSIIDNGIGIPSKIRDRIFEPYVTTKEGGTGLGLAIVKKMIEDHNGFIRALNNRPAGTRFVVELPALTNSIKRSAVRNISKDVEV